MSAADVVLTARDSADAYPLASVDKMATPPASVRGWDPKAERRVLWKVDLLLMPVLTISYGLQFVSSTAHAHHHTLLTVLQYDKFVFSSAAVFGMLNDLHLTTPVPGTTLVSTQRYSTA